jgi:rsbT co-antagonist protein RsbR
VADNAGRKSKASNQSKELAEILTSNRDEILRRWVAKQSQGVGRGLISQSALTSEATEVLDALIPAVASESDSIHDSNWDDVRDLLSSISRSRAEQGFSPSETAMFVFSLKEPLFEVIQSQSSDQGTLVRVMSTASTLLDALGLQTTEIHQKRREEVIAQQSRDMLELSTPVVTLWDGVLALPMIGTLDSSRTQVVMETLLQRIVETGADVAILDITGVPTVDTLTAQHLLKTVTAARLMGAECIISGIRPQIAQTIVHLGVDLGDIITKATLADAFRVALSRSGRYVTRSKGFGTGSSSRAEKDR